MSKDDATPTRNPDLYLLPPNPTAEELALLVEAVTGKKPTPEEIEKARKTLAA